ncbi:MAG: anthranilate synthase component I, partial [Peptostreptococcaceae bacterium]|nr:anthranilate synthase component I [Peptostreptococcaceae bacterium]
MVKPSLDAAKELARDYKIIPLSREIYSDIRTPIEVLKILKTISRHCYMLESMESPEKWGRYTFLGFDPTMEVTCIDGMLNIGLEKKIAIKVVHPKDYIRQILEENKSPKFDYLPPFTGGLVGYFSYDFVKYSEPTLKLDAEDQEGFKDVDLMLFDKVIAFDNLKQK